MFGFDGWWEFFGSGSEFTTERVGEKKETVAHQNWGGGREVRHASKLGRGRLLKFSSIDWRRESTLWCAVFL